MTAAELQPGVVVNHTGLGWFATIAKIATAERVLWFIDRPDPLLERFWPWLRIATTGERERHTLSNELQREACSYGRHRKKSFKTLNAAWLDAGLEAARIKDTVIRVRVASTGENLEKTRKYLQMVGRELPSNFQTMDVGKRVSTAVPAYSGQFGYQISGCEMVYNTLLTLQLLKLGLPFTYKGMR